MTNGLRTWEHWKRRYNSPPDDLVSDFYIPAFYRSIKYDRAVGFFSSRLLAEIAPQIDGFAANGGRIRLITSPANLSDDDLAAIERGEAIRERLRIGIEQSLDVPLSDPRLVHRLQLVTWMVATGVLEVQIALRRIRASYSLFHEKIGVFTDAVGNWMTFTGSPNETLGAFRRHSESFPLHRSWASDDQFAFATEERDRFEALWTGNVDGVVAWQASEWMLEPLRRNFGERRPSYPESEWFDSSVDTVEEPDDTQSYKISPISLCPAIPPTLVLRDYQKQAVNSWLAKGRGIFAMATGTGKTITALVAASQAAKASYANGLFVVVIVPLIDLVEQWMGEARWFGFLPAVCHGEMTQAETADLQRVLSSVRLGLKAKAEMVITTAATISLFNRDGSRGAALAKVIARTTARILVIGDEVHAIGTADRLAALPKNAHYRLGLSATPKRHLDDLGTERIFDYFGDVVTSISIRHAIYRLQALVEYDYHLVRVNLSSQESRQYRLISAKIAAAIASNNEERRDTEIRRRNRLVQHATGKLDALRALMEAGLCQRTHQIIYVAEGRSIDSEIKQLDQIDKMLREDYRMTVARYHGEVDSDNRQKLLQQFEDGEIQALLAMKCLDEGVDIPSAKIGVIMASSQNPRQFVQRRGRLLRKDPRSPKTHATIYDFIVLPIDTGTLTDAERRLLANELSRAAELAEACRNREVFFELVELAFDLGLDPNVCRWMKIAEHEEMEDWTQ